MGNDQGPPVTGSFVCAGSDLGRLLALNDSTAVVEFFDAPVVGGTVRQEFPIDQVQAASLEPQTRVWWNDNGQWRVGRVLEQPDDNTAAYLVAFLGKQNAELPSEQLWVRWSRPLTDPVRLLMSRATDARFIQRNRSTFMRKVLEHRSAAEGLVGISSSAIQLHQHQVNAARRVLLDPVRRYLLADEVGLGKTIEAGMVIRQTLLDEPDARGLVLVPEPLIRQWESELEEKFDIQGLNGGRVDVAPYRAALQTSAADQTPLTLLVIDEAHRLTGADAEPGLYDEVEHLAKTTPSLLLLSATPVRSNEDAFLRLLHLLDPDTYRLEDLGAFRVRVEQRDEIGDAITLLAQDTPLFLLSDAVDTLRNSFPEDLELAHMLDRLAEAVSSHDETWAQVEARLVRQYVSDTYRVHRRLIRTRRTASLALAFPVRQRARSDVWRLIDVDSRRKGIVEALDRFRGRLVDDGELPGPELLRVVAARCSAATPAVRALQRALEFEDVTGVLPFEQKALAVLRGHALGANLADWLREALDPDQVDSRLEAMADWAWSKVNTCKVAACSSYTSVARAAYEQMKESYGERRVAALLADMSISELEREHDRARSDDLCALLVCDTVAEEGWNLQFIREVLHLDLPWSANQLEQRLGRFDRFTLQGEHLEPVLSTVVADDDPLDVITGAWTRLLDGAFEIFTRSSATLQYALPEREHAAVKRALESGFAGIGVPVERERQELEKLRRHIEGQDLLDAVEDDDEQQRFFERLVDIDQKGKALGEATASWVGRALNFTASESSGTLRFGISTRNPPLLTESEIRHIGLECFNRRYALRRQDGGEGVALLRPGQPLVDALFELCLQDSRGTTFAGFQEYAGLPEESYPLPVFFFDVLIEPVITSDMPTADERMALQRQALKHLSPILEPIWFVPGRGEVPPNLRSQLLHRPTTDLGTDIERFHQLTAGIDWPATCRTAESEATNQVLARAQVTESLERAQLAVDRDETRVVAQLAARAQALHESFDATATATQFGLVRAAVSAPHVRTASCGVVILTRPRE